jgi:hypothetical protein
MDQNTETPRIIATCYLQQHGNEQNKLLLSAEHLQLRHQGRLRVFVLDHLRRLSFNHRKLMLPLVLGGITGSLSLVAIFKTQYNPWLMLSLMVGGLLAAYIGYQGSWVLTVEEDKNHTDYYLSSISANLRAFVAYANTFTSRQPKGVLYLPLSSEEWRDAREQVFIEVQSSRRLYYLQEINLLPAKSAVIIPVNSLNQSVLLSWENNEEAQMPVPYLQKGSRLSVQDLKPLFR